MKKLEFSLTFSLILIVSMASGALGVAIMGDYHSLPPFLTASVTPNLLLLIDNSASMYDLAYVKTVEKLWDHDNDPSTADVPRDKIIQCYDDSYSTTNDDGTPRVYSGYCDPAKYYKYDLTNMQFEAFSNLTDALIFFNGFTDTKYADSFTDPSVGIDYDLPAREPSIRMGSSLHEFPGLVDIELHVIGSQILRDDMVHDLVGKCLDDGPVVDPIFMLGCKDDGRYRNRPAV